MARVETVYEDEYGSIIDRPDDGYLEIRWFDTTRSLSKDAFKNWLSTFADLVGKHKRPGCLVDGTSFFMPHENQDMGWRDANIIPKYNAGGVKRFAFHMPDGMPLIGKAPAKEGPGEFPTGYFGTRADAVSWLKG